MSFPTATMPLGDAGPGKFPAISQELNPIGDRVLVYVGGSVTPDLAGWSVGGGATLVLVGNDVYADAILNAIIVSPAQGLDGYFDFSLFVGPGQIQALTVNGNALTKIIFGAFTLGSNFLSNTLIAQNNQLTEVTIGDVNGGCSIDLSGNALPQAQVDAILVSAAASVTANAGSGGSINLGGGTNGTPSATGLTAKATLEGHSMTITVN